MLGRKCQSNVDGYANFVFVNSKCHAWVYWQIAQKVRDILADYNKTHENPLPPISCHWFRHTFATRMYEAQVPPHTVQEILGHADLRMTIGTYTSISNDLKRQGIEDMIRILDAPELTTNFEADCIKLTTNLTKTA